MGNHSRGRRWYNSPGPVLSRRFGVLVFLTMMVWTYTIFTVSLFRGQTDIPKSEQLKEQILDLSKDYVKALSDEHGQGKSLPEAYTSYDLKKTMAVLLDSILERLGKLEKKVDHVINNNTQLFLRNNTNNNSTNSNSSSSSSNSNGHVAGDVDRGEVRIKEGPMEKPISMEELDCTMTNAELEGFSSCTAKMDWMRTMWRSDPCYAQYGVDGSDCSSRVYLSEVENWCPRVKGREHKSPLNLNLLDVEQAQVRLDKQGLFELMQDQSKFRWMKMRIARMWDTLWVPAAQSFMASAGNTTRTKKKILVHIGALTKESGFKIADNAFSGGPLGELVQWSDILSSLYILGHDLEISTAINSLGSFLRRKGLTSKANCPVKGKSLYDLVYIDIVGMKQLKKTIGGQWQQFSCILRVIDSFGTEPAFNVDSYIKKAGTKSTWGNWNLVPRQFYTMFPHTPDNSFMGFVVNNEMEGGVTPSYSGRPNRALVYGKRAAFWSEPWIKKYLDKIHKKFEIHATVYLNESTPQERNVIPSYVINHGLLSGTDIQKLLRETKLFIGLGFPYEGPAALEAVANGCAFLNPKFTPAKSSKNTKFFQGKPTSRALTSQHPYAEVYIGQPHVWTVDVMGPELDIALDSISEMTTLSQYLPFEFTCHGMLERLSLYIQKQEFCTGEKQWPPLSSLKIKVSKIKQSCRDRCMEEGLICEPSFFKHINSGPSIESATGSRCSSVTSVEEIYPPAVESTLLSTKCYTQAHHLLYSCAGGGPNHKRVCPCRDYIRGQVALCQSCRNEA